MHTADVIIASRTWTPESVADLNGIGSFLTGGFLIAYEKSTNLKKRATFVSVLHRGKESEKPKVFFIQIHCRVPHGTKVPQLPRKCCQVQVVCVINQLTALHYPKKSVG